MIKINKCFSRVKHFKKRAVLIMGCLFAITFSQGCSDFGTSSSGASGAVMLGNYDVKEKESIPISKYTGYDTKGITCVNAQVITADDSSKSSKSSYPTLTQQNSSGGVVSGTDKNLGTGDETEVITKSKKGQDAVNQAIKGNKELANTTAKRKAIVNYALQWVGNKYVYGGTSLTKGIDCSGFTMRIMEHFGIKLDRTSDDQRGNGKSAGKPQPGDIICYGGHVAFYIGDNKIVHASNEAAYPKGGIKISNNYKYRSVITIRNVID